MAKKINHKNCHTYSNKEIIETKNETMKAKSLFNHLEIQEKKEEANQNFLICYNIQKIV